MRPDAVKLDRRAIESACRRALLTYSALADKCRLNKKTLWKALRGQPVAGRTARSIAAALRISLKTLMLEPGEGDSQLPEAMTKVEQRRRGDCNVKD
jgi:hypothetical protein